MSHQGNYTRRKYNLDAVVRFSNCFANRIRRIISEEYDG